LRQLVGDVEQLRQPREICTSPSWPSTLGRRSSERVKSCFRRCAWAPGARQQGSGGTVLLVEQGQQQVLRLDELLVAAIARLWASARACWNLVVSLSMRMMIHAPKYKG